MKKRIGAIKGKPIVEGCNFNTITNNEILVENNKIIYRENGELKELSNNNNNNNNNNNSGSSSSRVLPEEIGSIKQHTYTLDNYANTIEDKAYDITSLITYSEELGVFVISKANYDEIKQRDSLNGELYFSVENNNNGVMASYLVNSPTDTIRVATITGTDWVPHKFYCPDIKSSYMIADFKNYYREFYLMVL